MSSKVDTEIEIMQDNLSDLRKIAGWTAEMLGRKLGLTKQTISNLETHKVKLSRVQYIAIRAVFECEVAARPENTTLRKVMEILFAAMPSSYHIHREQLRTAMVSIASIATTKLSNTQLYGSALALLAPMSHTVPSGHGMYGTCPSLQWLLDILEEPPENSTLEKTKPEGQGMEENRSMGDDNDEEY